MKRKLLVSLFVIALSSLALGQSVVPMPNLVDHQTLTSVGQTTFQATENIATAYNLVVVSLTCDWPAPYTNTPCAAPGTPPEDQNNVVFTPIETHYNNAYGWTQQEYYAIIPTIGSDTITFTSAIHCGCTIKAMVEQVQGIQADN